MRTIQPTNLRYNATHPKPHPPTHPFRMQATWYEIASGRAYLARCTPGLALKRFRAVLTHYETFYEDFFDFHNYCMRRLTLRAYVDSLAL